MSTKMIDENFSCPVCGTRWISKVVDSVSHQGQDSDFYPHYIGDDPLPYFLVQCPECAFCAYPDDYAKDNQPKHRISSKQIKEIQEQPHSKKLPKEAARYYLARKIYEDQKRNPYHIGNLYLRGSWCCRKLGNRRAEIEMQQLAVKFLRQSIDQSTLLNPDHLPIVTYLVGELFRRLEDRVHAREWFGTVEEVVFDSDQQWLIELTKKQAELNEHFIN